MSHYEENKVAKTETLRDISEEVARARRKFPGNRFMLAALTEEVGELAQAMLQKKGPTDIRREAVQVAAVAVRIIEEGDASFRSRGSRTRKHSAQSRLPRAPRTPLNASCAPWGRRTCSTRTTERSTRAQARTRASRS